MTNMNDDQAFVEKVKARIERQKNIGDMGFSPLSDKFAEGANVKAMWLSQYLSDRKSRVLDKDRLYSFLSNHRISTPHLFDRYCGALLGLAIGDALGTTLEFEPRDAQHISNIVGGGPFNLTAGWWTDDTSMACCLAYSLIKCGGFDASHLMECFSKWYLYGAYSPTGTCFDIGATTKAALDSFLKRGNPYAGNDDPQAAGNGSLMRLAPVAPYHSQDFEQLIHYASESSRVTHAAQEAIDACRYFSCLLYGALRGEPKDILLAENYAPVPGYWQANPLSPAVAKIAGGSYKVKSRAEIKSTGYVIDTLEAALWAFHHTNDFRSALIEAVNLGGDADTVGAVCGQISGAFYGETEIPIEWIVTIHGMQGFYHFAMDIMNVQSEHRS